MLFKSLKKKECYIKAITKIEQTVLQNPFSLVELDNLIFHDIEKFKLKLKETYPTLSKSELETFVEISLKLQQELSLKEIPKANINDFFAKKELSPLDTFIVKDLENIFQATLRPNKKLYIKSLNAEFFPHQFSQLWIAHYPRKK